MACVMPHSGVLAQSVSVDGSLPGGEDSPEAGVLLQPTHKEKYVIMPRVGYLWATQAAGPNPGSLGSPDDTSQLGVNNATSLGEGRWDGVGQWVVGLEYRQDRKRKSFISLDLDAVIVGEAGYGLRRFPPFSQPRSVGEGAYTALAAVGYGKYLPVSEGGLTSLRFAGKMGYLYGIATPIWLNVEYQQHIMLADQSYISVSMQGLFGFMFPSAFPDFSEEFTLQLWNDQRRGMIGVQFGIARVFADRQSRFEKPENPADKIEF